VEISPEKMVVKTDGTYRALFAAVDKPFLRALSLKIPGAAIFWGWQL
jgi:hypothetical protein